MTSKLVTHGMLVAARRRMTARLVCRCGYVARGNVAEVAARMAAHRAEAAGVVATGASTFTVPNTTSLSAGTTPGTYAYGDSFGGGVVVLEERILGS